MPESCAATQRDLKSLEKGVWKEPHDVQQREVLNLERKKHNVPVHAGGNPDGKQFGRAEPGGPGGPQVKHKLVKYLVREEILGCI